MFKFIFRLGVWVGAREQAKQDLAVISNMHKGAMWAVMPQEQRNGYAQCERDVVEVLERTTPAWTHLLRKELFGDKA